MNPAQIEALIADLMSRSTDAVNSGDQDRADIYEVAARVVREHADDAARAKTRFGRFAETGSVDDDDLPIVRRPVSYRAHLGELIHEHGTAKQAARAAALGLTH